VKLTIRLGTGALAVALLAGCEAMKGAANTTTGEANKASGSNSTAKDPGQGAPKDGGKGATQNAAAAIDMTQYMTCPNPYMMWPKDGAGLKQGWWISQKNTNAAGTSETKTAVVAMAGDDVKIEITNPMGAYKDYIWAVTAKKASGEVSWAGAGHKGEKPKDIKIGQKPQGGAADAPASTDEDCAVKAGTFKTKKTTVKGATGDTTTWMGTDGDAKDLVVKCAYPGGGYELESVAMEDMAMGAKTMKVKHVKMSNGMETWLMSESWPFVGNIAKMSMAGSTTEITGMGEDAKPDLNWEGK
jgi:hypothetical protein